MHLFIVGDIANPAPYRTALIRHELAAAGIPICTRASDGEVTGRLGPFTFERYWRYYVVDGHVPAEAAAELYADPVGHTDIRVDGMSGGCPPGAWGCSKYHIDSTQGLGLFVATLRRNGLVPLPDDPVAAAHDAASATADLAVEIASIAAKAMRERGPDIYVEAMLARAADAVQDARAAAEALREAARLATERRP